MTNFKIRRQGKSKGPDTGRAPWVSLLFLLGEPDKPPHCPGLFTGDPVRPEARIWPVRTGFLA